MSSAWRSVLYLVFMLAFFVVYKVLDPLGLESATKHSSATLFNAVTTPFYGMSSQNTHSNVAVVVINDNTLKDFDTSFPFSYARHIEVLNQILDAKPAAVFIDFRMMYERPGESLQQFIPLINRAKQAGIPILFARGDSAAPQPEMLEPLAQYGVYSNGVISNGTYPLIREEEEAPTEHKAPQKEEASDLSAKAANPAFALYAQLCAKNWKNYCHPLKEKDFNTPMVIHWGLEVDPNQSLVSRLDNPTDEDGKPLPRVWQSNNPSNASGFSRLWQSTKLAGAYALAYTKPTEDHFFPYPLVMGAEQLSYRGLDTKEGAPALAALLKDRAVFYGSDIRDQHDDNVIPLLGRVSGVVTHAMAFDNLLVYGHQYFHEPGESSLFKIFKLDWAEFTELMVWTLFSIYCVAKFPSNRKNLQRVVCFLKEKFLNFLPIDTFNKYRKPTLVGTKAAYLAILTIVMGIIDIAKRETCHGWPNIAALYFLIFFLFLLTWANPLQYKTQVKAEPIERGLFGQLLLIGSLSAIGFFINENFTRWPDADWIGLLLLYMATRNDKDAEDERNKFVTPLCNLVEKACSLIKKQTHKSKTSQ